MVITLKSVTVDGHSGTYHCKTTYPNNIGTDDKAKARTLHVLGKFHLHMGVLAWYLLA